MESTEGGAAPSDGDSERSQLTRAQRAQIERNRQRALMLRQSRQQSADLRRQPNNNNTNTATTNGLSASSSSQQQQQQQRVLCVAGSRVIDTGGGFFIDEQQQQQEQQQQKREPDDDDDDVGGGGGDWQSLAPLAPDCRPPCIECSAPVAGSFLLDTFARAVCEQCRRANRDKYALIARTEARREYLLSDADLDRRTPPLRYIARQNPHTSRAGATMRLYLRLDVERRALDVWRSEEALAAAHQRRDAKRDQIKRNKFRRQVRSLRMEMRSSVYRRELGQHEHTYGDERHDADSDTYSRTCTQCRHTQTYEKM